MPQSTTDNLGKQLHILANELTRANAHFHFAQALFDHRQQLASDEAFWDYTLETHCNYALFNLCRVYGSDKRGIDLFNCLQLIDRDCLDAAKRTQLNEYLALCGPKSHDPLVQSLRTWRNNIIAHYNREAALDRQSFDNENPKERAEMLRKLIARGFTILEWCSGLHCKPTA
jgi:hypothetical protein